MWHLYILPIVTTAGPNGPIYSPKYLRDLPVPNGIIVYGAVPFCLASADVDEATDQGLIGHMDVYRIPDDLDQKVNVPAVTDALENIHIPANWITASDSYRDVLRTVWGMFFFFERYMGLTGDDQPIINPPTVTLSTQFNQLSQAVRQGLIDTANSLNMNTSTLSGNNTLRQILKVLADQWGRWSFRIGGITV